MKRYLRSSTQSSSSKSVYISSATKYTDHDVYTWGNRKYSIYFKNADDPANFMCQVSEIHPYDLAKYAWAAKDAPTSATIYKDGKKIKTIGVKEYDEDDYEEDSEYINDVIFDMCKALRDANAKVKPVIDRT